MFGFDPAAAAEPARCNRNGTAAVVLRNPRRVIWVELQRLIFFAPQSGRALESHGPRLQEYRTSPPDARSSRPLSVCGKLAELRSVRWRVAASRPKTLGMAAPNEARFRNRPLAVTTGGCHAQTCFERACLGALPGAGRHAQAPLGRATHCLPRLLLVLEPCRKPIVGGLIGLSASGHATDYAIPWADPGGPQTPEIFRFGPIE